MESKKWISKRQEELIKESEQIMAFKTYEDLTIIQKLKLKELQEEFKTPDIFEQRAKEMKIFLENNPVPEKFLKNQKEND